jgi:hypothetical protein
MSIVPGRETMLVLELPRGKCRAWSGLSRANCSMPVEDEAFQNILVGKFPLVTVWPLACHPSAEPLAGRDSLGCLSDVACCTWGRCCRETIQTGGASSLIGPPCMLPDSGYSLFTVYIEVVQSAVPVSYKLFTLLHSPRLLTFFYKSLLDSAIPFHISYYNPLHSRSGTPSPPDPTKQSRFTHSEEHSFPIRCFPNHRGLFCRPTSHLNQISQDQRDFP